MEKSMTFTRDNMVVIGVGDMKVNNDPDKVLITHSLGSCIGIAVHDNKAGVGGILHFMLPLSHEDKAKQNPFMFADTGIPALFKALYELGAEKRNMTVKVAGGACIMSDKNIFNIGQRNVLVMKKIFWKNGILIKGEDTGGNSWRTMKVEIATGKVLIKNSKGEYEL